jgi:hypothetical protein
LWLLGWVVGLSVHPVIRLGPDQQKTFQTARIAQGARVARKRFLPSAGKMRKPKDSPPIGDVDSSRQGGAIFLESSFFPAFHNLFLGVLRALSD